VVDSVAVPKLCATIHTSKNNLSHSKSKQQNRCKKNTYSIRSRVSVFAHWGFSAPDRKLIAVDDIRRLAVIGQSNVLGVVVLAGVQFSYFE
jgi:hypothetical protein